MLQHNSFTSNGFAPAPGNFEVSMLGTENQAEPPMSPIHSLKTRRKKKEKEKEKKGVVHAAPL